ncbi:hypothetical protein [Haploplasma modicum]|jgi:hypothetical protein|uniref:hypothetical protein n=1 Tax=Haploplasma modicum TaxID=2150 RepID=UPI0004792040|nr:hypothetical protein [Haploplasma modicum]
MKVLMVILLILGLIGVAYGGFLFYESFQTDQVVGFVLIYIIGLSILIFGGVLLVFDLIILLIYLNRRKSRV